MEVLMLFMLAKSGLHLPFLFTLQPPFHGVKFLLQSHQTSLVFKGLVGLLSERNKAVSCVL